MIDRCKHFFKNIYLTLRDEVLKTEFKATHSGISKLVATQYREHSNRSEGLRPQEIVVRME